MPKQSTKVIKRDLYNKGGKKVGSKETKVTKTKHREVTYPTTHSK